MLVFILALSPPSSAFMKLHVTFRSFKVLHMHYARSLYNYFISKLYYFYNIEVHMLMDKKLVIGWYCSQDKVCNGSTCYFPHNSLSLFFLTQLCYIPHGTGRVKCRESNNTSSQSQWPAEPSIFSFSSNLLFVEFYRSDIETKEEEAHRQCFMDWL